ncbi:F-actin-capping protein subunit alpha [Entophlyctis luteolus]|nr:F-actin-capping protein subunit alpha [Entophlyctis luteolus]
MDGPKTRLALFHRAVMLFTASWILMAATWIALKRSDSKSEEKSKWTTTNSADVNAESPVILSSERVPDGETGSRIHETASLGPSVPFADYQTFTSSILHESGLETPPLLNPPPLFSDWVDFAEENGCFLDFKKYSQIYRDLAPFFKDNTGFRELANLADANVAEFNFVDRDNKNSKAFFGTQPAVFEPLQDLLQPLEPFMFALNNKFDEPQIIPADDQTARYLSPEDIFKNSECMRRKHDTATPENRIDETTDRYSHGFFLGPDTFIAKNSKMPLFSQCKTECFLDIVIPLNNHPDLVINGMVTDQIAWESKKDVLFWRGSSTSGKYIKGNPWRKFHRTRLVQWAEEFEQRYPENVFDAGQENPPKLPSRTNSNSSLAWLAVDIGFHATVQAHAEVEEALKEEYPFHSYVSFEDTMKFKYLLVVDGNTWPSRTPSYLTSNSVILLSTAFTDWYMWMLEPFVHYVPVKLDLSDLDDKLRWLRDNDDAARQISENANKLMDRINRLEQMQCYAGLAMIEYSRIYQNFKRGVPKTL